MKRNKPCPECRTTMEVKRTTIHFERNGFYADVENVSAYLCPQCGARALPGATALKIGETIDALFQSVKSAGRGLSGSKPAFTGISLHKVT